MTYMQHGLLHRIFRRDERGSLREWLVGLYGHKKKADLSKQLLPR